MNRLLVGTSLLLGALCTVVSAPRSTGAEEGGRLFAHNVYFTLHDSSPAAQQALVEACRAYLSGHEGTVFFATGARATAMQRDVNDTEFDVSLHIYFSSPAAHDAYQEAARHKEFIAKMSSSWKKVRVFDSLVTRAE